MTKAAELPNMSSARFFIHVKNTYFEVLWCLSEFMIFVTLRNTNHLNKNEYENKINYRS